MEVFRLQHMVDPVRLLILAAISLRFYMDNYAIVLSPGDILWITELNSHLFGALTFRFVSIGVSEFPRELSLASVASTMNGAGSGPFMYKKVLTFLLLILPSASTPCATGLQTNSVARPSLDCANTLHC